MNKIIVLIITLLIITFSGMAQNEPEQEEQKKASITVGVFNGGGSLLGADFEYMITDRVSFQLGAGFVGFGGGINYHLKPSIRSSMISLSYWHQGVGESFTQSIIGPCYVFRAKKLFTGQLGLGFLVEEGPAWPLETHTPVMLMYSIGIYLPI